MGLIKTLELTKYCHRLLQVNNFKDYCPNGLQIEGRPEISKIVSGVTASQAMIEKAIDEKADALLVHHGFFWRSEPDVITGVKRKRIATLLQHDINLFAYHLPLDAHIKLGNNVQLAEKLGFDFEGVASSGPAKNMLFYGTTPNSIGADALGDLLEEKLQHKPLVLKGHDRDIKKVAWCTGAAQHYIVEAAEMGADAFISGEVSESSMHLAQELGIDYFAAGHHATERYGVQALGSHLVEEFDIEHKFIDIPNPV